MRRRELIKAGLLGVAALPLLPFSFAVAADSADAFAALERSHGGRLGVAVLDTGSGKRLLHRADERFLLCSTGKLLAVAAVLARVDQGEERLDRRIVFRREDVLDWAPVTRSHAGPPGMTIEELCQAAMIVSDNTAMNLLLTTLGGPARLTRFVHGLGDPLTRFDRPEPSLNVPGPGGFEDTTTPLAMLDDMRQVLLGDVLSPASRGRLLDWLRHNTTGTAQLRAGLPAGWGAGDKTGASQTQNNDVAIVWPPGRAPLLIAAYYEGPELTAEARKAVLAQVGARAAGV
ncbi:beta-lactamase [Dyella thiooxydans]|uniref:Beta-lactamase n=1 Tax=Dyella thiooxydans TaxID=445710 RepID=A0A160N3Y4_9GAMM|nr:class A beta-lactamase [Dyella thiooxydans]AND70713.1 beta-lactamase [Dyella thiooxydans]